MNKRPLFDDVYIAGQELQDILANFDKAGVTKDELTVIFAGIESQLTANLMNIKSQIAAALSSIPPETLDAFLSETKNK
jgi:hypothetical protein